MTYSETQKEVVRDFLHSAILIDDEIIWSQESIDGGEEVTPDLQLTKPDDFDISANEPSPNDTASPIKSKLHAKPIIQSFSDLGIVCSPYTWDKHEDNFPNASDKADLLIIDWKLEEEQSSTEKGKYAKDFIKNRLKLDTEGADRLRFISIYTSERNQDVLPPLKDHLGSISGVTIEDTNEYLDVISKNGHKVCRISVIPKTSVPEDKLAGVLIEQFSIFVEGFFPNILLSSISEIRERTYEYLAQHHKGLDQALISHFTSVKSQKNTFDTSERHFCEYALNLVATSIQNSLAFSENVKKASSLKVLLSYLNDTDSLALWSENSKCEDKSKILQIVKSLDYEDFKNKSKEAFSLTGKNWDKFKDGKRPLFFQNPGLDSHLELSALDLLRRSYPQRKSTVPLRLGSILKHRTKNEFYLCVQPLCDGIRLDSNKRNGHPFPFLKLLETPNDVFDFVVPYEGQFMKFICETKPRNLATFKFHSKENTGDVRGRRYGKTGYHFFQSTIKKQSFKWLGELKEIYAQETLNLLAHQGSRVGNDKFEWLRLKNSK